jgi:hypothetical protein
VNSSPDLTQCGISLEAILTPVWVQIISVLQSVQTGFMGLSLEIVGMGFTAAGANVFFIPGLAASIRVILVTANLASSHCDSVFDDSDRDFKGGMDKGRSLEHLVLDVVDIFFDEQLKPLLSDRSIISWREGLSSLFYSFLQVFLGCSFRRLRFQSR